MKVMRGARIAGVVLAALVSVSALAQIRGVPPSVTSVRPGMRTAGVPASVTSLGPNGYSRTVSPGHNGYRHGSNGPISCPTAGLIPSAMGCTNPLFYPSVNYTTGQVQFGDGNARGRHHRVPRGWSGPAYYPYPVYTYPVYDTTNYADSEEQPEEPLPTPVPVQIQIQVEDKRAKEPEPAAAVETRPAERTPVVSEPVEQGPATVLVFLDGHQQEVRNYAIVGQTLYDLGTFVAHKIPLAELNLRETVKVNEDRGLEFRLPSGYKMD